MSIARKDDRYNADLAAEISDSFNRAVRGKQETDGDAGAESGEGGTRPQFVITGDQRNAGESDRSAR
jgi:hypothetical protein